MVDRYVNPALDSAMQIELLGSLPADPAVREAVHRRQLISIVAPGAPATAAINELAARLLA